MDAGLIKQMNWVDFFVIILLIRISYIALKNGIFVELFKLLGIILATYLSLHYYTRLGNLLNRFIKTDAVSMEVLDFLSLVILIIMGYIIAVILREGLSRFIKVDVASIIDRWLATILGLGRGILVASLIMCMFSLPVITYFKKSVDKSYLGERLLKIAPLIYSGIWNNFMSKFMPQEKFNQEILEFRQE